MNKKNKETNNQLLRDYDGESILDIVTPFDDGESILDIVKEVCLKLSYKTFDIYDKNDLYQEIFLMCMDALDRYDYKRPLENFLMYHCKRRLITLMRDKYYVSSNENKGKVYNTIELHKVKESQHPSVEISEDELDQKMIYDIIDNEIPNELRGFYLKMKSGVYVPKANREETLRVIREILSGPPYNYCFADEVKSDGVSTKLPDGVRWSQM